MGQKNNNITCKACGMTFKSPEELKKHVGKYHPELAEKNRIE
jgi:hypothetical protein